MNTLSNSADLQQLFVPECYRMYVPQPGVEANFLLLQVKAMEILTKRGKEKFAHNGFLYVFDKTRKTDYELKYWRCEQKKSLQSEAPY